ncbi:hypothetical protein J5N97_007877 [Dioscorea zingiberensis]|uniref:Pentatricopeptide repeat-containing protein n=1 Tax=Dioscorea zingiberensis TaxID=325984 RepID=A0A9D5HVA8_9LILI|nr:hypothetical protein J5N97_007877 [Dioscorea zingiberensis]
MHRSGLKPSFSSLSIVLSSCAKLGSLREGKQIHGLSLKTCSSANVYVATSLITMYSKSGVFDCLVQVFYGIECPNLASWNALLSGFVLNKRISSARKVFDRMPSRNVVTWTAMVNGYIEIKKVETAFGLFKLMPFKNVVSWSVMIGGFVSGNRFEEALQLHTDMVNAGVRPTVESVIKVIGACSGFGNPKQGRKIHCQVIKLGFSVHQIIEASLVSMYCDCLEIENTKLEFSKMEYKFIGSWNSLICGYIDNKKIDEARKLFDSMDERDNVSWNSMVCGYVRADRIDDALDLFSQMPEPSIEAITCLMSGYLKNGRIEDAQKLFGTIPQVDAMAHTTLIHGYMENGMLDNAWEHFNKMPEQNVVTFNVMISGLLQHGKVSEAYTLFTRFPQKDVVSWNILVIGFVENGLYFEAFQLYQEMILSVMCPAEQVITSLLRASAKLSLLTPGQEIHAVAIKVGHDSSLVVGNLLIDAYAKCGEISMAKAMFNQMDKRDTVTWNVMIYGYACNGFGKNALQVFERMKCSNIKPDDVTFLCVFSACTHEGLLREAEHYFNSMKFDFGIVPRLSHYACLIDLLCRMGMVEKAKKLIETMPIAADSAIWTSLLSGSRVNCNVKVAEVAASKLFAEDPTEWMPYLHLISIYGSAGRWHNVENLRNRMNRFRSTRQPGCSWIETFN